MRASTTRQPPTTTASTSAATTIRTQCAARRAPSDGFAGSTARIPRARARRPAGGGGRDAVREAEANRGREVRVVAGGRRRRLGDERRRRGTGREADDRPGRGRVGLDRQGRRGHRDGRGHGRGRLRCGRRRIRSGAAGSRTRGNAILQRRVAALARIPGVRNQISTVVTCPHGPGIDRSAARPKADFPGPLGSRSGRQVRAWNRADPGGPGRDARDRRRRGGRPTRTGSRAPTPASGTGGRRPPR